ncbi:hypothetical protein ACFTXB_13575 [Streptomyces sp. NPDC057074]|uniref:hypothetical protein n=1 Tax=Streptomyces sp. NPDC057074 TaxID=3346015 RepID=UPI003642440E
MRWARVGAGPVAGFVVMMLFWHFVSDESWPASVGAAALWVVVWSLGFFWWVRRVDKR